MNTYLTVMVTVLVATQVIRITQNSISLHRQNSEIKRHIGWIEQCEISEKDFETQREVYRLLKEKLEREEDGCGTMS